VDLSWFLSKKLLKYLTSIVAAISYIIT